MSPRWIDMLDWNRDSAENGFGLVGGGAVTGAGGGAATGGANMGGGKGCE